ncbi:DUF1272 domain-containing protein [Alphaproteobacteria bacterium]|jgi:hypothetical protein|nr:DUF1272 domain-containing protein [Alphaproteobacteria bacterium]
MLEIRPNCECCDKDLAPGAPDAMICSYECTFCRDCVEDILANICPNCGGGFALRPIRPNAPHRSGISLAHQPASVKRVHSKYTQGEMLQFSASVKAK